VCICTCGLVGGGASLCIGGGLWVGMGVWHNRYDVWLNCKLKLTCFISLPQLSIFFSNFVHSRAEF
jgi:hypothetical protein